MLAKNQHRLIFNLDKLTEQMPYLYLNQSVYSIQIGSRKLGLNNLKIIGSDMLKFFFWPRLIF